MKTENDCRCDKRINQLEEALRNIANGDMRTSRAKAKMALEGTFPPVDEKPEQEAKSHGNVYAVHDASCKTVAHFAVNNPADQHHKNDQHGKENSGFYFKGYWYQEYLKMREKYWKQTGENSEQAERIRELEEQRKVRGFLLNEAMKDLETEQAAKRELYAMLSHIVDWSPELPFYMKDEYKTLFRNALAAARELLSKCSVKEGKPKQGPIENIIDGLHNQSADLSTEELASELKEDGIDLDGLKKRVSRLIAEAKRQKEDK